MKGFVYVLKLKNGKYYVGSTNDLERRIEQHHAGNCLSTRKLRPLELLYSQEYPTITEARRIEKYIKKQKDKKFTEKFMNELKK